MQPAANAGSERTFRVVTPPPSGKVDGMLVWLSGRV